MSGTEDERARTAAAPEPTLRYGDEHHDQIADLTLPAAPATGPAPLVLLLHGGFWRPEYDRLHTAVVAHALAALGYAVANVEYRRLGAGGWATTLGDVALAADRLPGLIETARPGRTDPDRVVYAGHSAGGHLALWAAARDRLPAGAPGRTDGPPRVAGVVALAAVTDLVGSWRLGNGRGAVAEFLGGGPDEVPAAYAAADPTAIGAPKAPTVLVHGAADERLPVEAARRYRDAVGVELIEVPDAGHFELIDPASAAWPAVLTALRRVAPLA